VTDGRVLTDGLEVVVTHHCNLRCRACAYLSPVQRPTRVDPVSLQRSLTALASRFHASEARILGGEPLLHPDLVGVVVAVRNSGICDTIRLITNGTLLERASEALWDAVDEVSVSVYPGRELDPAAADVIQRTAGEHGVRLKFKTFDYFRQSYAETGTSDDGLVDRIYRTCQMAHSWRCLTVWSGHLYRCPQSLFLPSVLDSLDLAHEGIPIADDPGFGERLLDFLEDPRPLSACRNCLGSVGTLFYHTQIPRRTPWREPQAKAVEDLIDRQHLRYLEDHPGSVVRDTSYLVPGIGP
jgi:organic radical activating enzyme